MDAYRTVVKLFADWNPGDVQIRGIRDGDALVSLGLNLINSSPASGGNAAGTILATIRDHRGLSATAEDGGSPTWKYLLGGGDLVVAPVRGWVWVADADLPDQVGVFDLADVTGLSHHTVREKLRQWCRDGLLTPVGGFGEHGALSYPTSVVRRLAAGVPGRGRPRL